MFCTKGPFSVENGTSFYIENLSAYFSIFHDFRNWASFSHHFWLMKWILQHLITSGIITTFKIKNPLCALTPCTNMKTILDYVDITNSIFRKIAFPKS